MIIQEFVKAVKERFGGFTVGVKGRAFKPKPNHLFGNRPTKH